MQKQQKQPWGDDSNGPNDRLKNQFAQLKDIPVAQVQPKTRQVTLNVYLNCGCGSANVHVKRTVPFDSPLHDGDRIAERDILSTDIVI